MFLVLSTISGNNFLTKRKEEIKLPGTFSDLNGNEFLYFLYFLYRVELTYTVRLRRPMTSHCGDDVMISGRNLRSCFDAFMEDA